MFPYCLPYGWKTQKEKRDKQTVKPIPDVVSLTSVFEHVDKLEVVVELRLEFALFRYPVSGGVDVMAKSKDGIRSRHSTLEMGEQLKRISDGCTRIKTTTSTGKEYRAEPEEESMDPVPMTDSSSIADWLPLSTVVLMIIGSNALSKKSKIDGVTIISLERDWIPIEVLRVADLFKNGLFVVDDVSLTSMPLFFAVESHANVTLER